MPNTAHIILVYPMRKVFVNRFLIILLLSIWATLCFAASQQTSSTTAQTIINRAKDLLNGDDDDIFNDTEMLSWVNDGHVDIVARSHALQTTESVNLVADTIEYSLSTTYSTVLAVQYNDASGNVYALQPGTPAGVGVDVTLSYPKYWYEWAGKIGVYPSLSSVTTETVTVYIITRPTAITLTDNITVPAIYDKALTYYVAAQACWKDRQTARYAQLMQMYLNEIALYRADLNEIKEESQE